MRLKSVALEKPYYWKVEINGVSNCTGSPNKTDFASFEATTVVLQYIMLSTPLRLSVEAHLSASLLTVEVVGLYLLLISSELLASTFSLVPFFLIY